MSFSHLLKGDESCCSLQCSDITIGLPAITTITTTATTPNIVNITESKVPRTIVMNPTSNTSFGGISIYKAGYTFPTQWALNYKNKLAAAATGQCVIAFVGDSIAMGLNSSDLINTSYVGRLRASLQAQYGDGGSGFIGCRNGSIGMNPGKTGVAFLGTWGGATGYGCGPGSFFNASLADSASATFTVRGQKVDFYYVSDVGLPSCTVAIDGGTAVTVVTASGAPSVGVYTVTGLTNATHTVVITRQVGAAGQPFAIFGVRGSNPTGVIIDNYSIDGRTAANYVAPNSINYGSCFDWCGGRYLPADLVVYSLALNDATASGSTTTDAYGTAVMKFVQGLKNPSGTTSAADFLFIAPAIGNYQVASSLNYTLITNTLAGIARQYGAGFINLNALTGLNWQTFFLQNGWGTASADGTGAPGSNAVHPSDIGHQIYANYILPLLNLTMYTG